MRPQHSWTRRTKKKKNAAIAEIIQGKTVIVIAHRLHSIVNADQICVLNNGQVAGIGRRKTLLENCPEYAKLWQAAEGSAARGVTANAALEGGDIQ